MTIKIEDLPEGRNIKNIVFDITFGDGELIDVEKIIKTNPSRNEIFYAEAPKEKPFNMVEDSVPGYNTNLKPSIVETADDVIEKPNFENTVTREKKEVPKEMLDFNF